MKLKDFCKVANFTGTITIQEHGIEYLLLRCIPGTSLCLCKDLMLRKIKSIYNGTPNNIIILLEKEEKKD